MTVKDLLKQDVDIDVYDDVCEELGIAFCGPMQLTEAGKQRFSEVLDYEITLHNGFGGPVVIVHVDDEADAVWKRKLRKAKEFFESMAGYCSSDDYDKYFEEV